MTSEIKVDDFVVCDTDNGHTVQNGRQSAFVNHFNRHSVGVIREVGDPISTVHVIGENADYLLDNKFLRAIDPTKTGKGYPKKICNICHALKDHSDFQLNQTDARGIGTSRPSCRICRRDIEKKPMSAAAKRDAEKSRPQTGTLWQCPICRKRSIAGVTAKIVLDHRHSDGATRSFLCDSCNTGLGRFKNGDNYLKNAIAYLKQFET